jgi:hypothetical protein
MTVDDHPLAIVNARRGQPGDMDVGAPERDAAATFDRVDVQAGDARAAQLRNPAM